MAKEAKARFVTEVTPQKLISVTKRPFAKMDTIDEEERDIHTNESISSPFDREAYRELEVSLSA
ncbi:hypothetical protein Acr_17g0007340 [Actinidia rufa]|uniref:Uncharacterized protein n=1 Tax=Actinidia rufa TaxID=165716 RepID=A0A7J0G314_9ERIC|nr:hypothetical protein Acr_17g0007340 [Actinidia rufa]